MSKIGNDPTVQDFLLDTEMRQQIPVEVHSNLPLPPGLLSIERLAINYNPLRVAHNDLEQLMWMIVEENTPERVQNLQANDAANEGLSRLRIWSTLWTKCQTLKVGLLMLFKC